MNKMMSVVLSGHLHTSLFKWEQLPFPKLREGLSVFTVVLKDENRNFGDFHVILGLFFGSQ